NTFRSMTAHHCFKKVCKGKYRVGSAGLLAFSDHVGVRKGVYTELHKLGIKDQHHRRKCTKKLCKSYDLIIAMSTDHQKRLKKMGIQSHLFHELCGQGHKPVLDVEEAMKDPKEKQIERYCRNMVHHIHKSMPKLLKGVAKQF
ncbi:MAG: hypothetical protein QGG83_05875, partial [Candidatus Woesearchaeota archaeon]|nr:hypothetical protein [Candidatus Woesearchaeota archaeon]